MQNEFTSALAVGLATHGTCTMGSAGYPHEFGTGHARTPSRTRSETQGEH